ncbi:unnamed protein product [Aphanomyces euteiches]
MLTLYCIVVGEGRPFSIDIDAGKTVDHLKKKIKEEKDYKFPADTLQLYLALKGGLKDGTWLSDDDPDLVGLSQLAEGMPSYVNTEKKMKETKKLSKFFSGGDYPAYCNDEKIHVVVLVPLSEVTALEPTVPVHPSVDRKRRFDQLNQILAQAEIDASNDTNKKQKKSSSIKWELVAPLFFSVMSAYEQQEKAIPREILQELQDYSARAFTCFELSSCSEATLNIFIAPVLVQVCALFNGDIKIFAEETLKGKYVKANGRFEFVLKRGLKSIFIVEAKKEDFDQGAAQELVGAEVAAELGSLDVVYGIVTNFKEWVFYKSSNTKIEKDTSLIQRILQMIPAESLGSLQESLQALWATTQEQPRQERELVLISYLTTLASSSLHAPPLFFAVIPVDQAAVHLDTLLQLFFSVAFSAVGPAKRRIWVCSMCTFLTLSNAVMERMGLILEAVADVLDEVDPLEVNDEETPTGARRSLLVVQKSKFLPPTIPYIKQYVCAQLNKCAQMVGSDAFNQCMTLVEADVFSKIQAL